MFTFSALALQTQRPSLGAHSTTLNTLALAQCTVFCSSKRLGEENLEVLQGRICDAQAQPCNGILCSPHKRWGSSLRTCMNTSLRYVMVEKKEGNRKVWINYNVVEENDASMYKSTSATNCYYL